MSDERELADAIYWEIVSPASVDAALQLWQDAPAGLSARSVLWTLLARTSADAIEAVLARRAPLTIAERTRLFVLSGNPRRSAAEDAEYASLKARAEAEPAP